MYVIKVLLVARKRPSDDSVRLPYMSAPTGG